ncbi:hypothetical protein [Dokdonella immobilis]|uniref:Uncharacterized protein n=1 Tax=Dokdonella immobilis TaxID=578942 RepID=A0A1I5B091_9GAMM|nr:hypothetical protein [Dokdonella immobilis]SFN68050.1 hypothetical protein SAMN05216289_1476 [Dokdonella immobilis]
MKIILSISAKPSKLMAYFIWIWAAKQDSEDIPVEMINNKGSVSVEPGDYFIYWELYGSPGGFLACEVKKPDGKVVVAIKEPKIKDGKSFYALVKTFKA